MFAFEDMRMRAAVIAINSRDGITIISSQMNTLTVDKPIPEYTFYPSRQPNSPPCEPADSAQPFKGLTLKQYFQQCSRSFDRAAKKQAFKEPPPPKEEKFKIKIKDSVAVERLQKRSDRNKTEYDRISDGEHFLPLTNQLKAIKHTEPVPSILQRSQMQGTLYRSKMELPAQIRKQKAFPTNRVEVAAIFKRRAYLQNITSLRDSALQNRTNNRKNLLSLNSLQSTAQHDIRKLQQLEQDPSLSGQ